MVERPGVDLSVRRQCALLNLARSGVYRPKPVIGAGDLALMRRIDELHLQLPFYGSRRMMEMIRKRLWAAPGMCKRTSSPASAPSSA
jgi:putative transposase